MRSDPERDREQLHKTILLVEPLGFDHRGGWRFHKAGRVYDLGAADLGQLDRIEREGLFVVETYD